jgi:hydroxyacylglutathione hydrolase
MSQNHPLSDVAACALSVVGLPAFDSNYLWVIHNGFNAWAVDPGDATVVQAYLDQHGLTLAGILVTHHHADHVGGVLALQTRYPAAQVIGPMMECIQGLDTDAIDGVDYVLTGLNTGSNGKTAPFSAPHSAPLSARCIAVPGHTAGHVAYFLSNLAGTPRLFCGDTLFAAGCGRLFEGTPAQLLGSLHRLMTLPEQTLVYCAHEYTANNLRFAAAVEPSNQAIVRRQAAVSALRLSNTPSVPFVLGDERSSNPFLRCTQPETAASASRQAGIELRDELAVFTELRLWKNSF